VTIQGGVPHAQAEIYRCETAGWDSCAPGECRLLRGHAPPGRSPAFPGFDASASVTCPARGAEGTANLDAASNAGEPSYLPVTACSFAS